jgi:3-oxoacyl-[acyl-carrier-protein] synthase II
LTAPQPDASSAIAALKGALKVSKKSVDEVDAIFAHGTSTPLGDVAETIAIKKVFGERAYQIPITATKSQVGHMLGAAGAISALAAVKTIGEGVICPTINYQTPDPECDLDYVPNEARQHETDLALVNAFGFGGQNVVLVLGKYHNGSLKKVA